MKSCRKRSNKVTTCQLFRRKTDVKLFIIIIYRRVKHCLHRDASDWRRAANQIQPEDASQPGGGVLDICTPLIFLKDPDVCENNLNYEK